MELEIHGSKITRKSPDNQKLNSSLLNNSQTKKEIKREIKKYFKLTEGKNTIYSWKATIAVPGGKIYGIKHLYYKIRKAS